MAGTKISEATLRSTLKGTEQLPIVDTDLPKGKTTTADLKTYCTPDLSGYAADSNNILFRTYNAGVDSITFQVQSSIPLKLTEAGILENNQLLENKYAKITDLDDLATKTEVQTKLDTNTYNQDKSTFATKTELSAKVGGTGITAIKVVSALPDPQDDGVLYIVTGEEA